MRRLLAVLAAVGIVGAVAAVIGQTANPVKPTCVEVAAGDGWDAVAKAFAPAWWAQASQSERDAFTQVVIRGAGKRDVTDLPSPNEIVCINPARIPTTITTTTTTSSTTTTTTAVPATGWPDASNTGVPAGVTLATYTGPCTITQSNIVIDSKQITCDPLSIEGSNVTISRSLVVGRVATVTTTGTNPIQGSVTVVDSEVDSGHNYEGAVSYDRITVRRSEIRGGRVSVHCGDYCLVEDSWLHGQWAPATEPSGGVWHMDGFVSNGGTGQVVRHNRVACDWPHGDGGVCSAPFAQYGDFAPIQNVVVEKNLFVVTPGGYCAYFGYDQSKPYGTQAANIAVTGNVFQRGSNSLCGFYGPVAFWNYANGNTWTNNTWDDGAPLTPSDPGVVDG